MATVCALALVGPARHASAEAAPDFDLDRCVWNATHIVVATEGDRIDGRLTVIESWLGSLNRGSELDLPRLARLAPDAARGVTKDLRVSGSRMVLFLALDAGTGSWTPASDWWELEGSVCWVERGQAYALDGPRNEVGTSIRKLRQTEAQLRAHALSLLEMRSALAQSRGNEDVHARLQSAARFIHADSLLAVGEAFAIIESCGPVAVPLLVSLLEDDLDVYRDYCTCEALSAIRDPSAGPPLLRRLEQELIYWKRAKDLLDEGWWRGARFAEHREQHRHLGRLAHALEALAQIPAPGSEVTLRRTRELWTSATALRGVDYGSVVRACDAALQALADRQGRGE